MLKKIDQGRQFLKGNQQLFRCPLCHAGVAVTENGLVCHQNHRFDLSKKARFTFYLMG